MKYTIGIACFIWCSAVAYSQDSPDLLRVAIARADRDTALLLTDRGMNDFVAKKVAYFLSGEADLSLYSFSLNSDIADGTFSFNYNNSFRRRNSTGRISNVFSIGFTTDALQGLGVIIKNSKLQANIGANFKFTYLIPAVVSFTPVQKRRMVRQRANLYNSFNEKLRAENEENGYNPRATHKLINEFYEAEADKAIDGKQETYNWMRAAWISAYGYVPFTQTKNNYINNYTDTATSLLTTYNFKVSVEGNLMLESTRWGQFLATAGVSIFNSNEAISKLAEEVSLTDFQAADTTYNGFIRYTKLAEDEPYSKTLQNYTVGQFYLRFVYFFPFRWLGLSANYNTVVGGKHPSTFTFGLPISAPADKAGDKRLNIEPQLIVNDLFNIKDNKSVKEKLWFGIKIGVPFGSAIY